MKQLLILCAISIVALSTACKKTATNPVVGTDPGVRPGSVNDAERFNLSRDSIFLYAKQIYYWNDALPTYEAFNPRKFSGNTNLAGYNNELFELSQYKINPATGNPFEYTGNSYAKYSYIQDLSTKNPTAFTPQEKSSVDLEGNGSDIGIRFGLYGSNSNYKIYVTAVYQNSPADKAGFVRGDVVTKINGMAYGSNYPAEAASLNSAFGSSTLALEGMKTTGTGFSVSLSKAVFKSSPIYKSKVLTAGSKKIGYLSYARFSNAANSIAELNAVFNSFATNGVTDLVIDLRYNGGGYVSTAEHLINLIAPSTATGVMFSEYFNATMQAGNATILTNQPLLDDNGKLQYQNGKMVTYADIDYSVAENTSNFAKAGGLTGVQNVVFIVSSNTASASELVINSLKPHMNVKLVGAVTYGKPIGFFPITIENKYDVYFSLFETKNSLGQGGYFAGIVPDLQASEVPAGKVMYDFGNVEDNYLKQAINLLSPGTVGMNQTMALSEKQKSMAVQSANIINSDLVGNEFVGMIENRLKRKK